MYADEEGDDNKQAERKRERTSDSERAKKYRDNKKADPEKAIEFKLKERHRQARSRAFGKLGEVVTQQKMHKQFLDAVPEKYKDAVEVAAMKPLEVCPDAGVCLNCTEACSAVATLKPLEVCPDAGVCLGCTETCSAVGCSSSCACTHQAPSPWYYCNSMLHRQQPFKHVQVSVEKFLLKANLACGEGPKSSAVDNDGIFGLRVLEDCEKHDIIGEYTGVRTTAKKWKAVMNYTDKIHYITRYDGWYIEGCNELRYVNVACKPNVTFVDDHKNYLVATTAIKAGSMLHVEKYHYNLAEFGRKIQCKCKMTSDCRKGKVWL